MEEEKVYVQYYFESSETRSLYITPYRFEIPNTININQYIRDLKRDMFENEFDITEVLEFSRKLLLEKKATHIIVKRGNRLKSVPLHGTPITIILGDERTPASIISRSENKRILESWNIFEKTSERELLPKEITKAYKTKNIPIPPKSIEQIRQEKITEFLKQINNNKCPNNLKMLSDMTNRLYMIFHLTDCAHPGVFFKILNSTDEYFERFLRSYYDYYTYGGKSDNYWLRNDKFKYDEKKFYTTLKYLKQLDIIKYSVSTPRENNYIVAYKNLKVLNNDDLVLLDRQISHKKESLRNIQFDITKDYLYVRFDLYSDDIL